MDSQLGIAQLKKTASFFLKEKIKAARLAFTDATPPQLMTEEATSSEEWGPETKLMAEITHAAHRTEDCGKIMQVLRHRLDDSGGKNWRQLNKTLIVLEYLITHGPQQVVGEVSSDRDAIEELTRFQFIDERGFDRGRLVRAKALRLLQLITEADVLNEERKLAQKLSQAVRGFGGSSSGKFDVASNPSLKVEGFENSSTRRTSSFLDSDGGRGSLLKDEIERVVTQDSAKFVKNWNIFKSTAQAKDRHPSQSTHISTTDDDNWHPFEEESFAKSGLLQSSYDHGTAATQRKLDRTFDSPHLIGMSGNDDGTERSLKDLEATKAATPTVFGAQSVVPDLIDL